MSGFPATRYSVIERLRGEDGATRRAAFGDVAAGYWKPLYKYLRVHWHLSPEDAEELTQGFFSEAYQKEWLAGYDPGKARFRTFIRLCADRFVMNTRQAAARLKRGGGVETLSLDFPGAENELRRISHAAAADADDFFRGEFVRALFERALAAVREEYAASGRNVAFVIFERYDIDPVDGISYAGLARELDLTPTQVTNYLAHARRRFRTHALVALAALCASDEEFRREARELFGVEPE